MLTASNFNKLNPSQIFFKDFTSILRMPFQAPPCFPHVLTQPPPIKFPPCSQHLGESLIYINIYRKRSIKIYRYRYRYIDTDIYIYICTIKYSWISYHYLLSVNYFSETFLTKKSFFLKNCKV